MRTGPDVDEDQAPEVNDRQAVGEDRPLRCLREEVIHDAEDRRRQEEGDRVVPVPPLNERVLHARKNRVALQHRDGNLEAVDDVQDRDGDDRRDVEPNRDVEVFLAALAECPEEVDGEDDPNQRDRDVDRPLELGVLLTGRDAEWEAERGSDDDELPTPEVDRGQDVRGQPRLHQSLRRVVDAGEQHVAHERENHRVGVKRSQSSERQDGREIGRPERQL